MSTLIGEALQRAREARELTLKQVSLLTGFSTPYVFKVEHGEDLPSPAYLKALQKARLAPGSAYSEALLREDLLARWKTRGKKP